MLTVTRICRASVILFFLFSNVLLYEYENTLDAVPEVIKNTEANIFITISSLVSHSIQLQKHIERNIELNWFNVEKELVDNHDTWVGLFFKNPMEEGVSSAVANTTISSSEGYYKTDVSFPYFTFDMKDLTKTCLGYWIALIQNTRVLKSSCYSIQPNWMYEMRDIIGERTLPELMLPGTHNAGSYMRYDPLKDNIKVKYQICQDENIENQLIYGNRFLDLRPAYRDIGSNQEKFWISHGLFRTNNSIKSVLKAVREFLDSTKEIVIIDFHEFNLGILSSSHEDRHRKLMELIIQEVGHYALSRNHAYGRTLNELWKMNKRLLIGYADQRGDENLLFYPGVRHLWANKDNLQELIQFFVGRICQQGSYLLWSAMAELTPKFIHVAINAYGGIRKMAQDVNLNMTKLFRDEWWYCSNIVSTDYFLGNDIINVAIQSNQRKWER